MEGSKEGEEGTSGPRLPLAACEDGVDHEAKDLAHRCGEEEGLSPGASGVEQVPSKRDTQHTRQRPRSVAQTCSQAWKGRQAASERS